MFKYLVGAVVAVGAWLAFRDDRYEDRNGVRWSFGESSGPQNGSPNAPIVTIYWATADGYKLVPGGARQVAGPTPQHRISAIEGYALANKAYL